MVWETKLNLFEGDVFFFGEYNTKLPIEKKVLIKNQLNVNDALVSELYENPFKKGEGGGGNVSDVFKGFLWNFNEVFSSFIQSLSYKILSRGELMNFRKFCKILI